MRMTQPMDDLRKKLKELLIDRLKFEDMTPDDIKDDDPLFAGGLGLDSIDALEIVVMLETEFGIKVKNESAARDNFHSISSLADFNSSLAACSFSMMAFRYSLVSASSLSTRRRSLAPALDGSEAGRCFMSRGAKSTT